jgi:uncharacterized membrane protein YjjB (DUF3815 family)
MTPFATPLDFVLFVLQDVFWSGLAACGFAMLFNVPTRTLPGCIAAGALGHVARALSIQLGLGIEAGTLIGATTVGFLGILFSRYWHAPAPVFTIAGAIPMAPGTFAYRTMIAILSIATSNDPSLANGLLVEASVNAIKTGLIVGAIAVGIAAPALLFQRRKPVV